MESYDHVVVGGGAMGAATAWQLASRGHSVALIEQFDVAHARGSSHGAARIFRLSYRNPLYAQLALRALADWRELEAQTGQVLLEQIGQIDHGDPAALAAIEASTDRPAQRLSSTEATERWPGMRFDGDVLFSSDGGRCKADETVKALYRRVAELGGQVHTNLRVEDIEVSGDVATVSTAEGTFRTQSVVVAAGAWVEKLVGHLVALPTLTVNAGQPTHFQPIATMSDPTLWPSFIHHGGHAYGMYTPGEGIKIGTERSTVVPVDPDNRSFDIDPTWLDETQRYAQMWLPGLDWQSATAVTCLYTDAPDEHFVLDRRGPLTVVSPCSGHGFKFVPLIGRLAADLACGSEQTVPQWRFR